MTGIVTSSTLAPEVLLSAALDMLAVPTPKMIHNIAAKFDQLDANSGQALVRSRYNPLPTATVPLGNSGLPPPPTSISRVDLQAKPSFYGQYIPVNEQVILQNQDNVPANIVKRLGVSLRQTEDELTRYMFESTASFINCVNGTNGDNPTDLSRPDLNEVVSVLEDNDALTITDSIEGEDRYGTAPVRDAYIVMCNSKLIKDLENVPGFVPKAAYPNQDRVLREEWCTIGNFRFMTSSIGSKTLNASTNGNDIYNMFCCGIESYTVIGQDGYSAQMIYRPPILVGPLAQNAEMGWKMAQVPQIDNDAWVINLRATLSV